MDPEPLVIYVPSAIALAGIAAYVAYRRGVRRASSKPVPKQRRPHRSTQDGDGSDEA
jgi:hypothetical protein